MEMGLIMVLLTEMLIQFHVGVCCTEVRFITLWVDDQRRVWKRDSNEKKCCDQPMIVYGH